MQPSSFPQAGYNDNVRHRAEVFHIQTEDSGVRYGHVMTHLFADGGRIVKSMKTSYAEHVGKDGLADVVRTMMREQHKAMFRALRNGAFDEMLGLAAGPASIPPGPDTIPPSVKVSSPPPASVPAPPRVPSFSEPSEILVVPQPPLAHADVRVPPPPSETFREQAVADTVTRAVLDPLSPPAKSQVEAPRRKRYARTRKAGIFTETVGKGSDANARWSDRPKAEDMVKRQLAGTKG